MTYEELKNKVLGFKKEGLLALCFALVFTMGFGVGRFDRENRLAKEQYVNYTTSKPAPQTNGGEVKETPSPAQQVQGAATPADEKSAPAQDCPIKGNISSNKKTYHVKGGAFYARTNPEQCFATEAEAKAAGFIKSSR